MITEWDHYSYKVAAHFLSAMINGDYSGMTSEECRQYRQFEQEAFANARAAGWTVGHWATVDDSGDDWGRCDVTGLQAMREEVRLMVYKQGAEQAKPAPVHAWRTTPAGAEVLSLDGQDIAHAWRAKSGRFAGHVWSEPAPVYFDTMAEALDYIKGKTNAQ